MFGASRLKAGAAAFVIMLGAGCGGGEPGDPGDAAASTDATAMADAGVDAAVDAGVDAAAVDAAPPVPPPVPPMEAPVDAAGPWRVGYREVSITYVGAQPDAPRALRVALWYPTQDESGEASAYLLGRLQRPEIFADAGLALGRFPLVVFSHGSGGVAEQSAYLTERLATHGYVVAAPDHVGNTFSDGGGIPPEMFFQRPQDITAVLDALYDGAHGLDDDPLRGALTDQVLVAGHSFGAYTALAVGGTGYKVPVIDAACGARPDELFCQTWASGDYREVFEAGFRDPRVDAIVPLAPLGGPVFDFSAVDVPTLLVTAGLDATLEPPGNGDDVWRGLDGADDRRLDFPEAGHFSFSNICDAIPDAVADDGCGEGFTPSAQVHAVVNTYALAFARRHLFGDTRQDALLGGTPAPDESASLTLP
jgi:predicted dienelactone hydrolase